MVLAAVCMKLVQNKCIFLKVLLATRDRNAYKRALQNLEGQIQHHFLGLRILKVITRYGSFVGVVLISFLVN